jgi:hypothetical protein
VIHYQRLPTLLGRRPFWEGAELLNQNPAASPDRCHEIIRALRQKKGQPILAKIKTWLDAEQKLVLPRSPIAAAITYMLNQRIALCVYVTAGFLNIDNNAAERALKRVAIGRKKLALRR